MQLSSKNLVMSVLFLSALVLCATPAHLEGQNSVPNTITQSTHSSISFTVLDKDLHAVSTVQKEDIQVFVGDLAREIVSLERIGDQPLSLAILIDVSTSQERTLPGQKLTAEAFARRIMLQNRDDLAIVTFAEHSTIEQDLTKDVASVRQAIARIKFVPPGLGIDPTILGQPKRSKALPGSTALWDAIWATSQDMLRPANSRKAIVLLSDGDDTSSKIKMHEAIEHAIESDVVVFAIGTPNQRFGVQTDDLRKLSGRTGGLAFFPTKVKDLDAVFSEIEQQLRGQYKLTYRSDVGQRSAPQKVRLNIVNPAMRDKDLHLSYQQLSFPRRK